MNRRDSARIAAIRAREAGEAKGLAHSLAQGSACASEAFFPFADGLLEAVAAGATAVIQPGGSIRDDEVIAAADEQGVAMAFTGVRVCRHQVQSDASSPFAACEWGRGTAKRGGVTHRAPADPCTILRRGAA